NPEPELWALAAYPAKAIAVASIVARKSARISALKHRLGVPVASVVATNYHRVYRNTMRFPIHVAAWRQSGGPLRRRRRRATRSRRTDPAAPGRYYSTATASISIRNSGWAKAATATSVWAGIFLPKNSSRIGP